MRKLTMKQEIRRWIRLMKRKAHADGKALRYMVRHQEDGSYVILLDTNVSGKEISAESRKS